MYLDPLCSRPREGWQDMSALAYRLRLTWLRAALAVAVLALGAVLVPLLTGLGAPPAAAAGTTITGTRSGDHAWDINNGRKFDAVPSVTVDQTTDLTDQVVH